MRGVDQARAPALDGSVQAQVLDLLAELQADTGVAYPFISPDLAVVRRIAHRVVVLHGGRIVETAPTADLFAHPTDDQPTRSPHDEAADRRPRDVRATVAGVVRRA
ncbi:hypothetical protein [Frankia sp. QA3]|uniref:hypothetical protein n=1 Tax=Frankia sp. QA3 TaxID=710111 RepID=UPI000561DB11